MSKFGTNGVTGLLCVLVALLLGAILFPVPMGSGHKSAIVTACLSNTKQMAIGAIMYAGDNDDLFPNAHTWMDRMSSYTKPNSVFHCPVVVEKDPLGYGYAFKTSLSEVNQAKIKEPETKALLFDSLNLNRNATEERDPPAAFRRHVHPNIAYADGHAKRKLIEPQPKKL